MIAALGVLASTNGLTKWGYMLAVTAGIGLVTVLTRGSFFILPAGINVPSWMERLFRFAPACALAAVLAPEILVRRGAVAIDWRNEAIWGAVAGTLVFLRWRNMLAMMAAGLVVAALVRGVLV